MIKDKLLALRKRSGMSQQEVASAIDVTRQTVSNWEQGQGAPALDKAAALAKLYGVTLDDLASDEVSVVSSGRGTRRDLHVLERFVGKRVTIGFMDDDDRGAMTGVELLGVTESWLRVSYMQKTARLGSPKVASQPVVTLIDAADVASVVVERG